MSELYDPVRKKWVENTPEETVRQKIIQKMIGELGYPISFLAIEKELSKLPHLQLESKSMLPRRRADIIVFSNQIHPEFPLYPLLMIECKAVLITPKFVQQVVGYNSLVKAPFIALANEWEVITGRYEEEKGAYHFKKGLFHYRTLHPHSRLK